MVDDAPDNGNLDKRREGRLHPANLALRLILEIVALGGFGLLAWTSTTGRWRVLAVIIVICSVMALWGIFAVPDDPSRSGNAPIPFSGLIRLSLECAIFFGGALSFHWSGFSLAGVGLLLLVVVHYALSGARLLWLLQQ
jgi:uncharacterized membrane protein YdbT with pleckstrin-like domain